MEAVWGARPTRAERAERAERRPPTISRYCAL
jgi:hypothetical protein